MIKLKNASALTLAIVGYREGVISYSFEKVGSRNLKTYSRSTVGASTKMDVVDSNVDYYAGGADGIETFTKTSHEVEVYNLKIHLANYPSVGVSRQVEILNNSSSEEISEEEFNALKEGSQDRELAEIKEAQASLETDIPLPTQREDRSWWMAGWRFIVPTTAWKRKECVNSRSRSYDSWTADMSRLFLEEKTLDQSGLLPLTSLFCERVASKEGDKEALRVHPHLPIMTSIEVKEANTPKIPEGWVEILHNSSPWSRNSGDCLLFIDDVQIPLHEGKLFNEEEENCILLEAKPVGRGNLSGWEYRLAIPENSVYDAEYDNE